MKRSRCWNDSEKLCSSIDDFRWCINALDIKSIKYIKERKKKGDNRMMKMKKRQDGSWDD